MSETRATIRVHATPRANRDELAGVVEGVLRVRVTAPPVDGRANEAVERLIAGALGLPRSSVTVIGGHRSRHKTVAVAGMEQIELVAAITGLSRTKSPAG